MAGPDDHDPIEVWIDITPLLDELSSDHDGNGRLFLRLSRANGSDAVGELHECAVRSYDSKGRLLGELPLDIPDGDFGESILEIDAAMGDLKPE